MPTRIVERDGHAYAVIASMTNGMFAVVHRQASFSDLAGHWAEAEVNDMASRMIVTGSSDGGFHPGAAVARAEFAAMLVRALGLSANDSAIGGFKDVMASDWYADAVNAA